MQFSKNTSMATSKNILIKVALVLAIIVGALVILNRVEFPSPIKEIEKIIPNEKLKIVK